MKNSSAKFQRLAQAMMSSAFKSVCIAFSILSLQSCEPEELMDNDNSAGFLPPADCFPQNLQDGLIAFYPFNSGSLQDESGNGHDLINTTTAATTSDRDGNTTCSYTFNRSAGDFLKHTNPTFLNALNEISVSAWYMTYDTQDGGTSQQLVGRDTISACWNISCEWGVGIYDCRQPTFGYNNGGMWHPFAEPFDCQVAMDSMDNVWHHIVATYDNGAYQLWLDGLPSTYVANDGNCPDNSLPFHDGDLFLGRKLDGKLDDVAIYNRVLSNSEIQQLFALDACCGQ